MHLLKSVQLLGCISYAGGYLFYTKQGGKELEQFTFYELYADILQSTDDVSAGKLASCICAYEFEDREPDGEMTDKERFYWSNIADILKEVKETERAGKKPKKYNLQSRHFTFYAAYYNAMKLLNVRKRGTFIKAVCAYMFEDKPPAFEDKTMQGYFNLCKRKMDVSRKRKKSGRTGGMREKRIYAASPIEDATPTPQGTEEDEPQKMLTYEDFRAAYPDIQGNLFGTGQAYETALDWSDVALKFETDEELRKERNIYYLAKKYEQKYGQTSQANRVAKWDDLKDNL